MTKKVRLGLYLENEELKRKIKIVAIREGVSATEYCARAIEERLKKDMTPDDELMKKRVELIARMDEMRKKTGPIKMKTSDMVKEGRYR